ncbi:MAG: glutathione S-transferase [Rhodospirillaceae bacterium]|nr:MAG: glutathione S-transferase [Rhodospirillaceae bacterium]
MSNTQVILHHYPQSPVAEKVRMTLGLKGLDWHSVIIPRLPPKPNLMPLTGGYRLTPVMQIGADVYCDSACILDELEQRFPKPKLCADTGEGLENWTEGELFLDVVTVALVEMSATIPAEFMADRGPLYFGPDFSLSTLKSNYDGCLEKVRGQLSHLNDGLAAQAYLFGTTPGLADARAYYLVWFLRDRMAEAEAFFHQFENLERWESNLKKIGHGNPQELSDLEALDIAKNAKHETPENISADDCEGLKVGDKITIAPANGGPKVAGTLHNLSPNRIALLRQDERVGQVCVHFPRAGYVINTL